MQDSGGGARQQGLSNATKHCLTGKMHIHRYTVLLRAYELDQYRLEVGLLTSSMPVVLC